jgi:hypothetical protein
MSADQVAADLRAAADLLEHEGWTQGQFQDEETGCRCAAGALEAAAEEEISGRWLDGIAALTQQLGISPGPISLYRWNDTPGRTADEVIAALRAAADRAEADQ